MPQIEYLCIQVCLPGLHISLGIYDRLWELLEGECTQLDLLLAENTSVQGGESSFMNYVVALKKREQLNLSLTAAEQRVTVLDQLVTFFSLNLPNPSQNQQLKTIREASSKALLEVAAVVGDTWIRKQTRTNFTFLRTDQGIRFH